MPRTHWVGISTLWIRITKYPCLRYEPKQISIFCLRVEDISRTKIQRRWKHDSARLSCWWMLTRLISTAVLMPRNGCQTSLQSVFSAQYWMPVKWTVVWYFPLDTCINDVALPISLTKSRRRARKEASVPAVRFLWPSLYSSTRISLQHSTLVSTAWDQCINMMAVPIREPCNVFTSLHTT